MHTPPPLSSVLDHGRLWVERRQSCHNQVFFCFWCPFGALFLHKLVSLFFFPVRRYGKRKHTRTNHSNGEQSTACGLVLLGWRWLRARYLTYIRIGSRDSLIMDSSIFSVSLRLLLPSCASLTEAAGLWRRKLSPDMHPLIYSLACARTGTSKGWFCYTS